MSYIILYRGPQCICPCCPFQFCLSEPTFHHTRHPGSLVRSTVCGARMPAGESQFSYLLHGWPSVAWQVFFFFFFPNWNIPLRREKESHETQEINNGRTETWNVLQGPSPAVQKGVNCSGRRLAIWAAEWRLSWEISQTVELPESYAESFRVVTFLSFCWCGLCGDVSACESSLLLVNNPLPIFQIKTPWCTKLDTGTNITLVCHEFPF